MKKGLAVVVGIDRYRTFDASGGHDLLQAQAEGKRASASLKGLGYEVCALLDAEVTGAALRESFLGLCRRALEDDLALTFFFSGCGATLADGSLVLCTSDTDRSLQGAVPLDELAWIASTAGPARISVVLRCGFTGVEREGGRSRTLTPHARADLQRQLFRRSDVVVAWPRDAAVTDALPPSDQTPFGTIHLYQISGTAGGGLYDIEVPGGLPGRDGVMRAHGLGDPQAPPQFPAGFEYWHFAAAPWPPRFGLKPSTSAGPSTPAAYLKFDHSPFPAPSVVNPTGPAGTFFRIERHPGGTLMGFLRNHDASGSVTKQTWYAVPGQLDANKFFLFAQGQMLQFTKLATPPNIQGQVMHVTEADAH